MNINTTQKRKYTYNGQGNSQNPNRPRFRYQRDPLLLKNVKETPDDCRYILSCDPRFQELEEAFSEIKVNTITSIYGKVPKENDDNGLQKLQDILETLHILKSDIKPLLLSGLKIKNISSMLNGAGAKAPETIDSFINKNGAVQYKNLSDQCKRLCRSAAGSRLMERIHNASTLQYAHEQHQEREEFLALLKPDPILENELKIIFQRGEVDEDSFLDVLIEHLENTSN